MVDNYKDFNSVIFEDKPLFLKDKIKNSILNGATFTIKDNISIKDWSTALRFANKIASINCSRAGCNPPKINLV